MQATTSKGEQASGEKVIENSSHVVGCQEGEWAARRRLGKWVDKWEDSVGVL